MGHITLLLSERSIIFYAGRGEFLQACVPWVHIVKNHTIDQNSFVFFRKCSELHASVENIDLKILANVPLTVPLTLY